MGGVHRVEADQGGEQPNVCLGERVAAEVAGPGEDTFHLVQRFKQLGHRRTVGFLFLGEA